MSFANRFKSFVVRALNIEEYSSRPEFVQSDAGEAINEHTALGLSSVWGCTNIIAGTIGSLPLPVYQEVNGVKTLQKSHPLHRLLNESPNFEQTALDFLEFIAASLELWGNAYARIDRLENNQIAALTPIRPDAVSVRRLSNGELEYAWSDPFGTYRQGEESILHIRGFGGSPLGGLSTLHFARHSFGIARAAERATGSVFANGMRPPGALTFEKWLTEEQRETAETTLVAKYIGAQNAGKPLILEGGTKWETLAINPADAEMINTRRFSVEEICRFFGVPPYMIGHVDKGTASVRGLSEQTRAFEKFTLRRRLSRIEQSLMKQLLTPYERSRGFKIEFKIDGLMRGDSKSRSEFYKTALANGWMTINEVRALENLPPIDGGDVPRMQMQNVPITEAGKEQGDQDA